MNYDITIIGAGIVGLATAYSLLDKKPDLKLLVLEKEDGVSRHQTGNNSGVIHSGIYYKPGSLKASNCRRGYNMLLGFCDKHNIEYDICGKVIVATSEDEIPSLMNIYKRGNENGLEGLKILSAEEIKEIEPHTAGVKGILVPQTGIIDFKIVSEKLANLITERSGEIKFNSPIENIKINEENVEVSTPGNTYSSKYLIACGGLQSDWLAEMTNPEINIRIIPFRGEYYELKNDKRHLVKNLIYPVPDPAFPFLGVHFTRMIGGAVEAGPNAVLSFKREGYSKTSFSLKDTLDTFVWPGFRKIVMKYWKTGFGEFYRSFSKNAFVKALQKLLPEIKEEDLSPGGAGVRAQACGRDGKLLDDFYFVEEKRVIHVLNAPSPAATSSLSIGDYIADKALKRIN